MILGLTPDEVTGSFEICACFMTLKSVLVMWKSKQAYGASALASLFFTIWALWNTQFYPALHLMFAFWAGLGMFCVNVTYLLSMLYLRYRHGKPNHG